MGLELCGWHRLKLWSKNQMRTSILGIIVSAAVGLFAFVGVASPAGAGTAIIFGSGVWDSSALDSKPFSAPNSLFAFVFVLPNPIATNPSTDGADFEWILAQNGKILDTFLSPKVDVQFFPVGVQGGLFDLDSPGKDVVSFYGPDIGTSLTILQGRYPATLSMEDSPPIAGTGTVNVIVSPQDLTPLEITAFEAGLDLNALAGVVPESSTWVMMALGFAALAFAGYRARRRIAPSRSTIAASSHR
jgi:hypothetical protein